MKSLKILSVFLLFSLSSCATNLEPYEFRSLNALAKYLIENIQSEDREALEAAFLPKERYIEEFYPNSDRGKADGALDGETYWNTFIGFRRSPNMGWYVSQYSENLTGEFKVLDEGTVSKQDGFTLLTEVHLQLTLSDGTTITDESLLGAVLYYDRRYSLLNVFSD